MSFKRKPPPGNVRRVINLGNNLRGVTTNKCGHLVQFESEQEQKLILLLERDHTVADYHSQPETLYFRDANARKRHYTPDFKVWRIDGQIELHEVTVATRQASRESLRQREEAARAICSERGWRYLVHTDETLPAAHEYVNLMALAAFRAQSFACPDLTAWWLEHLSENKPVHPCRVIDQAIPAQEQGTLLANLYHLLWHGVIQMDWRQPFFWHDDLHPTARIWLSPTKTKQESSL